MPVTPGATGASFDVLLAFSLDPEANRRVQAGVSTLEAELKRLQEEARGVGPEYKKSGEEVKKTSKEVSAALKAEARAMAAEASAIVDGYKAAQIGLLRDLSSSISSISQKALITGGAIVGGIFAEVQRYVSAAPDATRETRAWAAETERLGKARARIDAVLLREALPLLRQAGRLANEAAGIVERHPEIVSLALKAGTILVGVGAIGLAVSKGIKLVADVQYLATIPAQLTAAKLQDAAANKQLLAARSRLKDLGGSIPGGGGGSGALKNAVPFAGLALASLGGSFALAKQLDAIDQKLGEVAQKSPFLTGLLSNVTKGLELGLAPLFPFIGGFRTLSQSMPQVTKLLERFGLVAKDVAEDVSEAAGQIRGSANEAEIVEAFSNWKEDDARLIKEAAENRKDILAEAERAIADLTRNYASQRVDINRRFNDNRSNITRSFEQESTRAAEDHARARADTVAQGNERIRELEESHQERLREIRESAAESIESATFSRDALALVRAQNKLTEDEQEENRSFRLEQARARRETAQRIQELDSQYAIERERRQAQFQQDLADNEAQRAEELKRAAQAFQEEQTQAREAQAQKLQELQEGLNAERIRRREVFHAEINDLDTYLLGDRDIRNRHYQESLTAAEAYFSQLRSIQASSLSALIGSTGGRIPTRDGGGYASPGIYGLAMNGIPEFVLSGSTTAAAERAIGANLTDEALSKLFGRLGEMRSAVYNDNRRMDAPLSKDARSIYEKTATRALQKALGVL